MRRHRKPGHPDPHPQARQQARHASPAKALLAAPGRLGSRAPGGDAKSPGLRFKAGSSLTSWAASGFSFPIPPTQGEACERSGALPAPPSGVGLGWSRGGVLGPWSPAPPRSRTPGPPQGSCLEARARSQRRARIVLGTRRGAEAAEVRATAAGSRTPARCSARSRPAVLEAGPAAATAARTRAAVTPWICPSWPRR